MTSEGLVMPEGPGTHGPFGPADQSETSMQPFGPLSVNCVPKIISLDPLSSINNVLRLSDRHISPIPSHLLEQ